jgi:hypothetical protein
MLLMVNAASGPTGEVKVKSTGNCAFAPSPRTRDTVTLPDGSDGVTRFNVVEEGTLLGVTFVVPKYTIVVVSKPVPCICTAVPVFAGPVLGVILVAVKGPVLTAKLDFGPPAAQPAREMSIGARVRDRREGLNLGVMLISALSRGERATDCFSESMLVHSAWTI